MTTEKIYNEDSYCKTCTSKIISIDGNDVIFDKTCFYPESGGQPGDNGLFQSYEVINTKTDNQKSLVIHKFKDTKGLSVGDTGVCEINWENRYQNMRLHSALHILYLSFVDTYGQCKVRGATISQNKGRLDLEFFEEIDMDTITYKVNSVIESSCEILTYPNEKNPDFRCWEIKNFPPIPCGGTHVRNTTEIGAVKCKSKSKGKQGQRIYIDFQE